MSSLKDLQEVIQLLKYDSVVQIDDEIRKKENEVQEYQKKIIEMEKEIVLLIMF